jgi:hypothetical protein
LLFMGKPPLIWYALLAQLNHRVGLGGDQTVRHGNRAVAVEYRLLPLGALRR